MDPRTSILSELLQCASARPQRGTDTTGLRRTDPAHSPKPRIGRNALLAVTFFAPKWSDRQQTHRKTRHVCVHGKATNCAGGADSLEDALGIGHHSRNCRGVVGNSNLRFCDVRLLSRREVGKAHLEQFPDFPLKKTSTTGTRAESRQRVLTT